MWIITKYNSLETEAEWKLPGSLSESEIEQILQRLVCADLSPSEIINASRRRDDPLRASFLDRVGEGSPISYGDNPHYVAKRTA